MATIEPRLIHLLNESTASQPGNADRLFQRLPTPHLNSSNGPLPPLERDATQRVGRAERTATDTRDGRDSRDGADQAFGEDTAGISDYRNRVALLGDFSGDYPTPPAPVSHLMYPPLPPATTNRPKLLDNTLDPTDDPTKKRVRTLGIIDDFMPLPQPVKKLKAAQPATVMPPIINGLHEPPSYPALFPPIAPASFNHNEPATLQNLLPDPNQPPDPAPEPVRGKQRKRASKPRKKWSEEETTQLLLGVDRHGVGKWTAIMEDPDFKFDGRTAGDLKDRFRTCCPVELRKCPQTTPPRSLPGRRPATDSSAHFGKILIGKQDSLGEGPAPPENEAPPDPKPSEKPKTKRKSRAHRKKMEDLADLGIHQPFRKSERRERRPFNEQDDREILQGLRSYGPAWTKIQRDSRFHLSTRQPTDLRDRVRNKYPEIYARIEKGTLPVVDGKRTLEPTVETSIEYSFQASKASNFESQVNRTTSREELPRWPPQAAPDPASFLSASSFDFPETSPSHSDMDISRLLLDDNRYMSANPRLGIEGLPEASASALALLESCRAEPESSENPQDRGQRGGR